MSDGRGGAGGAGGAGIVLINDATVDNSGNITGGAGGLGGNGGGGLAGGNGGVGGAGGVGILVTDGGGTISNSGNITGGNGVAGGSSGAGTISNGAAGAGGAGGAGIIGSNLSITNSGSISGGLASDGVTRGNALQLSGTNTLSFTNATSGLTGSIEIDNGMLVFDQPSGATTVSSAITSGTNVDVRKTGNGEITFTGANNYTGILEIDAGILRVSGAGVLTNPLTFLLVNGGTLDLGGTTQFLSNLMVLDGGVIENGTLSSSAGFDVLSGSISASLTGTAAVIKETNGAVILDGVNTYTGGTVVTGTQGTGPLVIGDAAHPGASVAGDVFVTGAGLLMGHGSIGGNLTNATLNNFSSGGIVAPGGSIGTLTVHGNYMQDGTSTLAIEVSPSTASQLRVGGSASLAGTLALTFDPGVYTGKTFALVSAGSITGTFGTVTNNAPQLNQSLVYTANEVDLTASGSFTVAPTEDSVFGSLGGVALMGAQQANATVLGHLADQHDGSGTDTVKTSLAGEAPTQLAFGGSTQALASVVSALPDAMTRMGGWFRALGTFADLDSSASAPGFNSRAGGFMAGFDGPVADNLRLGIAGGYGHTDLSAADSESGAIDTPRIALYGSSSIAGVSIDALAGYGYDMIHAQRPIAALGAVASSHHNGQEANAALQASKPFVFGDLTVQPAAGVTYTHLFENSFAETGAGAFDLSSPTRGTDSLRPFVSASASQAFVTGSGLRIVPEADISYSYETMSTPPSLVQVGGGSFSVDDARPSRNELQIGGGVTMAMTNQLALHVAYHAVLPTGNLLEQIVEAGASYRF